MNPLIAQAIELSNNQLAGGVIAVLVTMIGQHFAFKKYIRDAAGIKDTTNTKITGQPLKVVEAKEYITRRDHAEACGHMERRVTALEGRATIIEKKMESDKSEIIDAGEDRAVKIHDRINVAIEKIGELKGQVTEIAKRVK